MDTLRCGVVGLGRGRLFVEKLNAVPGCEVVAVCDSKPAALEAFAGLACYTEYDQFIAEADLDAVAIISPGPDHAAQSLIAMDHGVHVISETPCVYSLDEAQAVADTVRRTGLKYMLAEDYIYTGWVQRWGDIIAAGELGEIVAGQSEYTHDCRDIFLVGEDGNYVPWAARDAHPEATPSWRAEGLPPLKYCSHTLGPLLHFMQDRCTSVCGYQTGPHTFPAAGTIDYASAVMETAGGRVITLTNGFGLAHPFVFLLGLYGTKGSIRCVSFAFGDPQIRIYQDSEGGGWRELQMEWNDRPDGRDWIEVMLDEFVQSIRDDTEPRIGLAKSMDYTVPGICAHISAERGGERVEIPDYR